MEFFTGSAEKRAPFVLPASSGKKAALVESGVDALSLRALGFTGLILAFGGQAKRLIAETTLKLHTEGWEVISAFDNDVAGQNMAIDVELALMGLTQPARMTPAAKDWNEDLQNLQSTRSLSVAKPRRHEGPSQDSSLDL